MSLAPSVTSILVALGARRQLVAVSKWCKDVADVSGLPELGDCWALASNPRDEGVSGDDEIAADADCWLGAIQD